MILMRFSIIILILSNIFCVKAQKEISLQFTPLWNQNIIQQDSSFISGVDTYIISELKFYISNIQLKKGDNIVFRENNSFHLLDISIIHLMKVIFKVPDTLSFDEISFNLGIDSTINVSGALDGDLDPTKGMYWTWQSGYINLKLEGKKISSNASQIPFQFHLGGYLKPYYPLQTIKLKTKKNKSSNFVTIDLQKIFSEINLEKINHIMSPGADAVEVSRIIAKHFSIN